MTEKLRIGLVGSSWWTELMFLPALKAHPGAEVAAISSRTSDRLLAFAAKHRIPSIYTDYHEMFDKAGLDAVVVAPPDDLHKEMTLAALDSGLHVLCEKPLAPNAADAWAMQEAAEKSGLITMVLFTWRFQPHFGFLRDFIRDGGIGKPRRAQFGFFHGFVRQSGYEWRLDPRRATGTLGDLGSHFVDLSRWYFGEIKSVTARLETVVDRSRIPGHEGGSTNDSARLMLSFEDGPETLIDVGAAVPVGDRFMTHMMRIEGETASIELDYAFGGAEVGLKLRLVRDGEAAVPLAVPAHYYGASNPNEPFDIYRTESVGPRLFIDSIAAGRKVTPNFTDGAKAQEVIDAALRSNRERRSIDL